MTDSHQPQPSPKPPSQPFDENSALAELENLADKIRLSRQEREGKVAEFDAFVRGFREERYRSSIAASEREIAALDSARPTSVIAAAQSARNATTAPAPSPSPVTASGSQSPAVTAPAPVGSVPAPSTDVSGEAGRSFWDSQATLEVEAVAAPKAGLSIPRPAFIGVAVATLAVIVVAAQLWRSAVTPASEQGPVSPPETSPATAPPAAAPPQAAATPPAPPVPARALNIEFVTIRPVWARILVDGNRAHEKTFPPDTRLPIGADQSVVIRVGDVGAVRLVVDGRDQGVLGRDGQSLTLRYTAKPKTP